LIYSTYLIASLWSSRINQVASWRDDQLFPNPLIENSEALGVFQVFRAMRGRLVYDGALSIRMVSLQNEFSE
jgi:hypothetical protein